MGLPVETQEGTTIITKKPHKLDMPSRDTTEVNDTTRVPIGFNPSVEDWKENNIEPTGSY